MRIINSLLLFTIPLLSGCDNKSSDSPQISQAVRSGRTVATSDPKYVDRDPHLSADGTKIIFLSGRLVADDGSNSLRIFKASRSGTSADFGTITRVTPDATKFVRETYAKLSPDGTKILIQGATSTESTLQLCSWDGSSCETVSTTPAGKGQFDFSPDSSLFYYLADQSSDEFSCNIASSSAPTTSFALGGSAQKWQGAFWVGGAKTLAVTGMDSTNLVVTKYSLTAASDATSATGTKILSKVPEHSYFDTFGLNASTFLGVNKLDPMTSSFLELGEKDTATKKSFYADNQVHQYSVAAGTDTLSVSLLGISTITAILDSSGTVIFTLNRIVGRCDQDNDYVFGNAIATIGSSTGATPKWVYLVKPTDGSVIPKVGTDFCDPQVPDSMARLDLSVDSFAVNNNATSANYTATWVSTITGDSEVFVMDNAAGVPTLRNVSNNRKLP